jgi:hypothetical protein
MAKTQPDQTPATEPVLVDGEPQDDVERTLGTGAKGSISDPEAPPTEEEKAELDGTAGDPEYGVEPDGEAEQPTVEDAQGPTSTAANTGEQANTEEDLNG